MGLLAVAALMVGGVAGCSTTATTQDSDSAGVTGMQPEGGAEAGAPDAAPPADGSVPARTSGQTLLDQSRSLVVTATTTVRTDDVLGATARALDVMAAHDAVVVDQRTSTAEDPVPYGAPEGSSPDDLACPADDPACPPRGYASSSVTVRVAPQGVDSLLADLGRLGSQVAVTREVSDVTAEVADVDARVKTAQASLNRVRALLSRAQNLGDVVALEQELSTRQANLESLQAQQRALADQTALATVTLLLVDVQTPPPPEPTTGFLLGLSKGWDAFTGALAVGLTVLGALLPFLILAVVVVVPTVIVVRRRSTRSAPPRD
jgi:hypothetical protein